MLIFKITIMKNSFIVFLLVLAFSCKNETTKTDIQALKVEGLSLNNNEKWTANEETHIGMNRIDSILKTNTTSNGKILGDALSKQTSYIIKSCDMTGEAHNQLHVILIPILEEITAVKDVEDISTLKKKKTTLMGLTAIYFDHFKN